MRIKAFYTKSQPQILLEEIIQYFVDSQEFYSEKKANATIAAIPYGEREMTGAIQALGFSYLRSAKHKGIIIATQSDLTKEIITTTANTWGTILGNKVTIAQEIIKKQKRRQTNNELVQESQAISYQLPFHMISSNLPLIPLILPTKLTSGQERSIITTIQKENYGFILSVSGIQEKKGENPLEKDRKLITALQEHTINRRNKENKKFYDLYKISQKLNLDLVLSGYTNTKQSESKEDSATSYISLIG